MDDDNTVFIRVPDINDLPEGFFVDERGLVCVRISDECVEMVRFLFGEEA